MKKLLLILLLAIFTISGMYSQELTIKSLEGEPLGESVVIYDEGDGISEIVFHALVTNNTSSDMTVHLIRTQIEMVPGSSSQFCWGENCYPPFVNESVTPLLIPAGTTTGDDAFSGHYVPAGNHGTSTILYKFYNADNPSVFAEITAYYVYGFVGVEDQFAELSFSDFYPNPATNQIKLDYALANNHQASVSVVNVLGSTVKDLTISGSGTLNMDVSDLQQGIYFCSIRCDGQVYTTKRIVVQK